jgi:hypothetical protein
MIRWHFSKSHEPNHTSNFSYVSETVTLTLAFVENTPYGRFSMGKSDPRGTSTNDIASKGTSETLCMTYWKYNSVIPRYCRSVTEKYIHRINKNFILRKSSQKWNNNEDLKGIMVECRRKCRKSSDFHGDHQAADASLPYC